MSRSDVLVELEHGVLRTKARGKGATPRLVVSSSHLPVREQDGNQRPEIARMDGIEKTYPRGAEVVHAVRGADVALKEAEMVGLIGRSGSGKTTLLNIMAGWERPDVGSVAVAGRDPSSYPFPWKEVAVVPQRLGLMEELTIRENVEYPARLSGCLQERGQAIDELVEALGLTGMESRFPHEVSVGEQQRAALARAMVLSPLLLLAEEPVGHQDSGWAVTVFEVLRRRVREGTCCLAATHDEEAISYVDRLLSMSDGRVTEMSA